MKTDLVLTMDEYLNACCVARPVKAPAKDARHIPITTEVMRIFIPRTALVGATVGVTPALIVLIMESEVNKMEYVIAFTVVAMMGLYVLILGRCLRGA